MNNRRRMMTRAWRMRFRKYKRIYVLTGRIKPISPLKAGRMNGRHDLYKPWFIGIDEIRYYNIEEAKRFYGL